MKTNKNQKGTIVKTNTQNNKGFTLIELIMVTIILGILAAVAIPRYMATVTQAEEAAEDAVIASIKAGLETHATEQLMANGRRSWPDNPFTGLETKPALYLHSVVNGETVSTDDKAAPTLDGEWTFFGTSLKHQRGDNTVTSWVYNKGQQEGHSANVGSITDGVNAAQQ